LADPVHKEALRQLEQEAHPFAIDEAAHFELVQYARLKKVAGADQRRVHLFLSGWADLGCCFLHTSGSATLQHGRPGAQRTPDAGAGEGQPCKQIRANPVPLNAVITWNLRNRGRKDVIGAFQIPGFLQ